jgi:eukaryotic-like serine/threonine-protein kinase
VAAKTIKDNNATLNFARECNIWLGFDEPGIVPLLKVTKINDIILALMPRHSGSLRELIKQRSLTPNEILKSLHLPITALASTYQKYGIVHQDIKPENILYEWDGTGLSLRISDWGIANVKAGLFFPSRSEISQFIMETMGGLGTIPYMAPERFTSYLSDIRADIYSLGIMFFEILTGNLPYVSTRSIPEQIITGEYFEMARHILSVFPNRKRSNLILSMIHPAEDKRPQEYKGILKYIQSL